MELPKVHSVLARYLLHNHEQKNKGAVTMNILLCCAAGMSTSLLVTKMEKAAQEMGVDAKIWAVSADEVKQNLDHADVLLLGPQIRYKLPQLKKEAEMKGVPVDMINPSDYGMVNGKKVLEHALRMKK
jgi:PTS system cellobiose-specific IIB component